MREPGVAKAACLEREVFPCFSWVFDPFISLLGGTKVNKFKRLCGIIALISLGLFMLAGCSDDSSSSSSGGRYGNDGKGHLGQINGVVYDTITLKPVDKVDVWIGSNTSSYKTQTAADGSWLIRDVDVGDQTVTFSKAGYRFTSQTVTVAPNEYNADNPFLHDDAFQAQLEALVNWSKSNNIPEYDNSTGDVTWKYDNGTWIAGDGTAVTVTQDSGEFKFKVDPALRQDYTYRKFQTSLMGLVPLTGAIKGKIWLIQSTEELSKDITLTSADVVPIPAGINIWFKDLANHQVGTGVNQMAWLTQLTTTAGGFETRTLPAGVNLELKFDPFVNDGFTYKAEDLKKWDWGTGSFVALVAADINANPCDANTINTIQEIDFYIFANAGYVFVTNAVIGTPEIPVLPSGTITLDFNQPINPAGFKADLYVEDNAKGFPAGGTTLPLTPEWVTTTKVNLTRTDGMNFPYSVNPGVLTGRLMIEGYGTNQAKIYADKTADIDIGLPVFTAEGLAVAVVELAPAEVIPPRAVVAVAASAIKITFNKNISPATQFDWGTGATLAAFAKKGPADWRFVGTSSNTVYVYTADLSFVNADRLKLRIQGAAAADPTDSLITGANQGILLNNGDEFLKARNFPNFALVATNIWAGKPIGASPDDANANYSIGAVGGATPALTLTFNQNIPTGTVIRAEINTGDIADFSVPGAWDATIIPTNVSYADKVLTITPSVRLKASTPYYVKIVMTVEGETLFDGDSLNIYDKVILAESAANKNIAFKTAVDPAAAVNAVSIQGGTGTIVGDAIVITDAKIGTMYYIVFSGPLNIVGEAVNPTYNTDDTNVTFVNVIRSGNVLSFRLQASAALTVDTTVNLERTAGNPGLNNLNTAGDLTIQVQLKK